MGALAGEKKRESWRLSRSSNVLESGNEVFQGSINTKFNEFLYRFLLVHKVSEDSFNPKSANRVEELAARASAHLVHHSRLKKKSSEISARSVLSLCPSPWVRPNRWAWIGTSNLAEALNTRAGQ